MSKEEKPLSYESRIIDTKGTAQRLDLRYFEKPNRFVDLRRKLTWAAPIIAAAAVIPFLSGVGSFDKAFSSGPLSKSHAIFEKNCQSCHAKAFTAVADLTCNQCHDGASHPAKAVDTGKPNHEVRCATCHVEHRGSAMLSEVSDKNCSSCHASLKENGMGVTLRNASITAFKSGKHPDFPAPALTDNRPLKLNHAAHMPKTPKTIRGMKLPMKCTECHAAGANATGGLEPVTFEANCKQCHQRELEFVLPGLPLTAPPAPHSKDTAEIRRHIRATYENLVAANPSLVRQSLEREWTLEPSAAAWIEKASLRSTNYLFENKCKYCHEYDPGAGDFPAIRKVNRIQGHYVDGKPEGEPWLQRAEFAHRSHRAIDCASCHSAAPASTKTTDVLVPGMKSCTACHGSSGTAIDRCSECHLYHNRAKETDHDRRNVEELIGSLRVPR